MAPGPGEAAAQGADVVGTGRPGSAVLAVRVRPFEEFGGRRGILRAAGSEDHRPIMLDHAKGAEVLMDSEAVRAGLLHRRRQTLERIAALERDFAGIVESVPAANDDEHDPEGPTIAFERATVQTLLDESRRRAADLDRALVRLDAGIYGRCDRCGRRIAAERLQARPWAERCIDCATVD